MNAMTHTERVLNTLHRKPVDLLACGDTMWSETYDRWIHGTKTFPEGGDPVSFFDMSWRGGGWINSVADIDFRVQVLEETEETILQLDGNGARLRCWKGKSGTPEHVGFSVEERSQWEERIKPHLLSVDRRRYDLDGYRKTRALAAAENRAFCWNGVAPFEQMHPVCGHENLLIGMALDPDWVKDMVMTYADFTILHLEELFQEGGAPDFMWFYEDMGFKERPFMSPAMYEEIVMPGHKRLFDYAHGKGLKVLVHSCGFVEPLVPGLVHAGMDCLQAMEVKAGMDMPRMARQFGDRIAFCGNMDVRLLEQNDRAKIEEEIQRKVAAVMKMGGSYILASDHSIPPSVNTETLKWFFDHGRTLARLYEPRS